ncbi:MULTISPECIES: PLD nuclease N-terminal domain-containing protein [Pseudomonas]|jgi:hypothetical protein|uniref:PLDc_N domain-containing protein n=2 Tax=Pseudomonas TaxID=286 RepID=A0A2X2ECF7_PSELU|nr:MULTISPECIES: PLD nuclease N-terminal domain-containing protein [Pseudomonas]ENA29586.1 hypothetical protein HMPREF1487_07839 [Pseudomonas sp. HPB0071]MBA1247835.1 PLDc_N domain-containing protein [Pseudomonas zeshuii]MBF8640564.1 PLDc_N domain-containing protein [Pseudomonas zeshuii]MBH3437173.1 PLDc_N domain-containing protein [Pseudomonas luteola]MBW5413218.1 hypothetical protein [Pseudomonas sp. MAG002Y]
MINSTIGGVIGFIVFLLDIWAIVSVIRSDSTSNKKIFWTLLIIILPVVGLIAWGLAGPRGSTSVSAPTHKG